MTFTFIKDLKETTAADLKVIKKLLSNEIDEKQANMVINMLDKTNHVIVVNKEGNRVYVTKEAKA